MKKSSCHRGCDPQPCSGREQRRVTNPYYHTLPSPSKPVLPPKPQRKKEASSDFPSKHLQLGRALSTPQLYGSGDSTMLASTELENRLDTPPTPPPRAHLRSNSRDRPLPTPRAHRLFPPPLPRQPPTQSPSLSPRSDWYQPSLLPVREASYHPVHHPPSAPLSWSTTRVPSVSVSTPASVSSPRSAPGTPLLQPHMHHSALAALTLGELAKQPDHLPTTIETVDGFYGFGAQFTISTGDQLLVHFAKNTKVVTLRDRLGMEYNVPLSSAMKFGLVREPIEVPEVFETASDIPAQTRHLPPVICAQQSVPRRGKYDGVEEGEILITRLKPSSRSGLTCYSLTTNREKTLHGDCKGHFTTAPEKTSMYLLDILGHLRNSLPCSVRLYPPTTNKKNEELEIMSGKIFTLKECTTKTSLVVSNVISDVSGKLFDILLDRDLSKLRVFILDAQHAGKVQNKEDFSKSVTDGQYTMLTNTAYGFARSFQKSLYSTIRHGFETEGVEIASRRMRGKAKLQVVDKDEDGYVRVHHHLYATEDEQCSPSKPSVKKNKAYLTSLSMHQVSLNVSSIGIAIYMYIQVH